MEQLKILNLTLCHVLHNYENDLQNKLSECWCRIVLYALKQNQEECTRCIL